MSPTSRASKVVCQIPFFVIECVLIGEAFKGATTHGWSCPFRHSLNAVDRPEYVCGKWGERWGIANSIFRMEVTDLRNTFSYKDSALIDCDRKKNEGEFQKQFLRWKAYVRPKMN